MQDAEYARFCAADSSDLDYFYRCWCAKEAWYKRLKPQQQARTTLRSICYQALCQGLDGSRLIEGRGDDFHLALIAQASRSFEQRFLLEP